MTCLALLSLLSLSATPQGPTLSSAPATSLGFQSLEFLSIGFPDRPEQMSHVPFRDAAGAPLTAAVRRFGTLDLDGNHIEDAFWLGTANGANDLQLAMGREHSPGRFRDWPLQHPITGPVADAATLRQAWMDQDTLLLADPNAQYLTRLSFNLATAGDPHLNGSFATSPFLTIPAQLGAVEITSGNAEGDQCDDIVVVYDRGPLGYSVIKYRLDAPYGVPLLSGTARIDVPWVVQRVQLLDFDGNGSGDIAAELPGLGVVIVLDDGSTQLQIADHVPTTQCTDLAVGRFDSSDALALATTFGVLAMWRELGQLRWRWLPAPAGTTTCTTALLPQGSNIEIAAFAADGRTLQLQTLTRGVSPAPHATIVPDDPAAYYGFTGACGLARADLDGDGDVDLVLQHPDGAQWYTVRNQSTGARPRLSALSQDLSLVSLGWYGATYTVVVPQGWDFVTMPLLELQVMVEHPYTGQQLRWDNRIASIDPLTRSATFTVQWQDSSQQMAAILANPNLVPFAFTQAGYATAGCRAQLNFLGMGIGNVWYNGADYRGEPLVIYTDPGGSGNKSAQGVVWEERTAPPLPKADDALLPWQ